jgi:hypothetical protein
VIRFSIIVFVACADRQLPPPTTIATGVDRVVAIPGGALWTVVEDSAMALVRWSRATDSIEILDRGPLHYYDSGALTITAGADGVVWGFTGGFLTPSRLRFVPTGATGYEILPGQAQRSVLDQSAGGVVFVTFDENTSLQRLDLETGVTETLVTLDPNRVGQSIAVGDHVYMELADSGHFLRVFDLSAPTSSKALAHVHFVTGLAANDEHLFWIDQSLDREQTRVHRAPLGGLSIETILDLGDQRASAPVWNRDALWILLHDGNSSHSLARLRDGELATYATDYEPGRIVSSDSDLLITVHPPPDSGEPALLLRQPLD